MDKKNSLDLKPLWIYLLFSLVVPAIIAFIYGIITLGKNVDVNKIIYISSIVSEIIILIILAIVYHKKLITEAKKLSKKEICFILLSAVGIIVLNEILSNIFASLEVKMENQDMIIDMFSLYKIPTIISIAICAPIVEELVFRYSLSTLIKNDKAFLIISSIVFGVFHGVGVATIIYVIIGLLLGLVYLKTKKNIVAPIIIHILNNSFSVILLLLGF